MFLLIVFLACLFVSVGIGVFAGLSDIRGLTIPNSYSLGVTAAFIVCYGVLWAFGQGDVFFSISSHLLAALIVFGVTVAMFAFGLLGAADSKLGTAYALWAGLPGIFPFLFYMTLMGGVLGLVSLGLKKWTPVKDPKEGSWVARVQAGESKVPYGVAIVIGALASFVNIGYFNIDVLASFLMR